MSILLPRYYRSQLARQDALAVDRAVRESIDVSPQTVARATLPGDTRRLRGVPVCTFGVQGTQPGTDPLGELLRWER
jgi:hypothetical protein